MQLAERSSYLAAQARQQDPDRYLCALFAPADRRDAVMALVLLNQELARVPDVVSQPMAGYIRYQWWRDAIDEAARGEARAHPVVQELADSLRHGWVDASALQALVDARESELEGLAVGDSDRLERYVQSTSGALQRLIHAALSGTETVEAAAAEHIGTAFGLVGIVRALGHEIGEGRSRRSRLATILLGQRNEADGSMPAALVPTVQTLLARAEAHLVRGRATAEHPPRARMAAFLPAALTDRYLHQLRAAGADPDRIATLRRPATAPLLLGWRMLRRQP